MMGLPKVKAFIVLISVIVLSCQQPQPSFDIDTQIDQRIQQHKNSGDHFSDPTIGFALWNLFPTDSAAWADDPQTLMEGAVSIPCDCVLRNDTAIIQGGIFYESGIGFQIFVTKLSFDGHVIIASTSKSLKYNPDGESHDELKISGEHQSLQLAAMPKLELGENIKGHFVIRNVNFVTVEGEKNELKSAEMELLFDCRLSENSSF